MKKPLILCMVVLCFALMPGTAFAIGYCKDVAPTESPDKTFDDEWTLNVDGEVEFTPVERPVVSKETQEPQEQETNETPEK